MKRGQLEMLGLVFIVVIIVLGIVLYLRFSPVGPGSNAVKIQGATSFLVALTETTVPNCDANFQQVAAACLEGTPFCSSGEPCLELLPVMQKIGDDTLKDHGMKYNLSIEGTGVIASTTDCVSADPSVDLIATPAVPIVLSAGRDARSLKLALCQ